jgi:hypothetical protein
MKKDDIILISLFNKPDTPEEIKKTISAYDNPETQHFIKNFFWKMGIPPENIDITVKYENNVVKVDAKVI